ncbi:MAG: adenylate/guanylate cyclase domain-containing protein [Bacteroidota bacterium]
MSRLLGILFILCCFGIEAARAQSEELDLRVFEFEDGLTHRNVFKILQDHYGYIWVATSNGLNRFDGRRFVQYLNSDPINQIPDNYIPDMVIPSDSMIWLTNKNQLTILDPRNNQVRKRAIRTKNTRRFGSTLPDNLYVDSKDRIWTIDFVPETGQSFLLRTDVDKKELKDVLVCQGTFPGRSIIEYNESFFISDLNNGLRQISEDGRTTKEYLFRSPFSGNRSSWVTKMTIGPKGALWALLNDGQVFSLAPGADEFQIHPITNFIYNTSSFSTIQLEPNGNIWVGGIGALWRYESQTGRSVNFDARVRELTKNNCTYRQIFQDASGVLWVASDFGAIRITRSDRLFTNYLSEGNENCSNGFCSMRGMAEDDEGNIYLSYYNSIHVLDPIANSLRPLFPQNDFFNFPFGLYHRDGMLYVGNGKRIHLDNLQVDTLIPGAGGDKGFVTTGPDGLVWWAHQEKLFRFDPSNDRMTRLSDAQGVLDSVQEINFLLTAKDGASVWIGTNTMGLLHFHPEEGTKAVYQSDSGAVLSLSHNRIIAIHEAEEGDLWLATADGVNHLNTKTQSLKIYKEKDGLPNNFINGLIAEGDSCLWISTDNGLARLSIEQQTFINFFKQDGLSKNEFNRVSFLKAKDGRFYFGGLNGVNAFYPGSKFLERSKEEVYPMMFSSFSKLDGDSDSILVQTNGLSGRRSFVLDHNDKFFTFEFALAHFENPAEILYSYQLEGFDKEWSEPTVLNTARYNNIPAGKYIFRAKASPGKGVWNARQLAIDIYVQEAYYKTWWFYALIGFGLLLILYVYLRYRVYSIGMRQKELEAIVSARTEELEREKKKSDDLLLNILPVNIAEELKRFGKAKAKRHESVTVMFIDFQSFSHIAAKLEPEDLVAEIDFCFRAFDEIMEIFGLEKIKTIGDAYMCVGGILNEDALSAVQVVRAALEIQSFLHNLSKERAEQGLLSFEARIGIHTGPVVGGVVGTKKFAYDIWGDTVNIASRMETTGQTNKVNISQATYELVADFFECQARGKITVRNVGDVEMYFVIKEKIVDQVGLKV